MRGQGVARTIAGKWHYEESLALYHEVGAKPGLVVGLEVSGWLAVAQGHAGRAARLLGGADGLREAICTVLEPANEARHAQAVASDLGALPPDVFDAAWNEGRAMSWDEAVAYALEDEG